MISIWDVNRVFFTSFLQRFVEFSSYRKSETGRRIHVYITS